MSKDHIILGASFRYVIPNTRGAWFDFESESELGFRTCIIISLSPAWNIICRPTITTTEPMSIGPLGAGTSELDHV